MSVDLPGQGERQRVGDRPGEEGEALSSERRKATDAIWGSFNDSKSVSQGRSEQPPPELQSPVKFREGQIQLS